MKRIALMTICVAMMATSSLSQEAVVNVDARLLIEMQDRVSRLEDANLRRLVPPGTIVAFYGTEAPIGWLLCDGSTIASEFSALRAAVGDKTPDLRGVFLRGLNFGRDASAGDTEPKRRLGSYQNDMFESHSHVLTLNGRAGNSAFVNRDPSWGYDDWRGNRQGARTEAVGGAETRPRNVAVAYIIKY